MAERNLRQAAYHLQMRKHLVFLTVVTSLGSVSGLRSQEARPVGKTDEIGSVVGALNRLFANPSPDRAAAIFSSGGELWSGGAVLGTGPMAIAGALQNRREWSEVTAPHLQAKSVRLLSDDVALVDASSTQYGSMIVKRTVPVLLILKKESANWRVVSMRLPGLCGVDTQTDGVANVP